VRSVEPGLEERLREIAHAAQPLSERLREAKRRPRDGSDELPEDAANDLAEQRLNAWCEAATKGDWQLFEQRLAFEGLNLGHARAIVAAQGPMSADLPPWAASLRALIEGLLSDLDEGGEPTAVEGQGFLAAQCPVPFEEILGRLVIEARERLQRATGEIRAVLSARAHASLERSLLWRLAKVSECALMMEFSATRFQAANSGADFAQALLGQAPRSRYQAFVRDTLRGGLVQLFRTYPVLARLVATVIDQWVLANSELIQRLHADRNELKQAFGIRLSAGAVVDLDPALSDPHHGGRAVVILKFAAGAKVVYKPRDLALEAAFWKLIAWLDARQPALPFKPLTLLDRGAYGWVEFVEHLPCHDTGEVDRYYRRTGMLVCLLDVLGAVDCHFENVIVHRDHPVPIDLEALMHPVLKPGYALDDAISLADEQLGLSIWSIGLLPNWRREVNGVPLNSSGLGAAKEQATGMKGRRWKNINTDSMTYDHVPLTMTSPTTLGDGVPEPSPRHIEHLVLRGFEEMYGLLRAQRDALLDEHSPLEAFRGQAGRYIFRPSHLYGRLLNKLVEAPYLSHGIERGIELEALCRGHFVHDPSCGCNGCWAFLVREIEAMEQLDIPHIGVSTDADAGILGLDNGAGPRFKASGFESARSRLRELEAPYLQRQNALIQASFRVATLPGAGGDAAPALARSEKLRDPSSPAEPAVLIEAAARIGRSLAATAVRSADGGAAWIAPTYHPDLHRFLLQPAPLGVFSGNAGIALFLAGLETVLGTGEFRDLAVGCFAPLRARVRQVGHDGLVRELGLGGGTGVGSLLYGLARTGTLLREDRLLDQARDLTMLLTQRSIDADVHLDAVLGTAGLLLGLLVVHETTGEARALELARHCGGHLIGHRIKSEVGPRAWRTLNGSMLTGLSHGAAGISYALLRLHQATGQSEYEQAALEGIAYERSLYVAQAKNWPDLRRSPEGQPLSGGGFLNAWCHGATGIGLARLGGLRCGLSATEALAEVEAALATTLATPLAGADHVCCGESGRLELQVVAAQQLERKELLATARTRAAAMLARAERAGGFQLPNDFPPEIASPGFFHGTSGVAYQLLRLAVPDRLPSVLLWA